MSFNFTAAVTALSDLELKKMKSVTASTCYPSICHEVMGPDDMILVFFNAEFYANFFFLFFSLSYLFVSLSPFFLLLEV